MREERGHRGVSSAWCGAGVSQSAWEWEEDRSVVLAGLGESMVGADFELAMV